LGAGSTAGLVPKSERTLAARGGEVREWERERERGVLESRARVRKGERAQGAEGREEPKEPGGCGSWRLRG
jgi:hypothetical protein